MTERQQLSAEKVETLRTAFRALLSTPEFSGKKDSRSELIAHAMQLMMYAEQTGHMLPNGASKEQKDFAVALHALTLEFKGDKKLSIDSVITMRTQFLNALFSAMAEQDKPVARVTPPASDGYVEQLAARSKNPGLRQGADDPLHPEKSLNNFMNDIRGLLLPVIDVYERLNYALTTPGGEKHKFFAATSKAGMRFDSQGDARGAMNLLDKLIGEDGAKSFDEMMEVALPPEVIAEFHKQIGDKNISMFDALAHQKNREILNALIDETTRADIEEVFRNSMTIESETINYKTFYWLKVPSAKANQISSVVTSLNEERKQVENLFAVGNANGDISAAEDARSQLLERVESVTLGDSHLAEQIVRRLLATKETARQ